MIETIANITITKMEIATENNVFNNRYLFPNFNTSVYINEETNIKAKAIITSANKT